MTKSINMFKINRKLRNTKYFLLPPVWMHEIWNVSMDRRIYRIENWTIISNKSLCICLIYWNIHTWILNSIMKNTQTNARLSIARFYFVIYTGGLAGSNFVNWDACKLVCNYQNYEFSTNYRLINGQSDLNLVKNVSKRSMWSENPDL